MLTFCSPFLSFGIFINGTKTSLLAHHVRMSEQKQLNKNNYEDRDAGKRRRANEERVNHRYLQT